MSETPDLGPESDLKEPSEEQRTGHDPQDLLQSTEEQQMDRERELRADEARGEESQE